MPNILNYLEGVNLQDKEFIGTIAFRSEELSLLDGSKMALGIDDGLWVLVYQASPHAPFQAFKYDHNEKRIFLDQKTGGEEELQLFKKHLAYFFKHAKVEDLVTLLPPQKQL